MNQLVGHHAPRTSITRSIYPVPEIARITPHHRKILPLRHLILPHPKTPRQRHLMLRLAWITLRFARRTPHRERPGRDIDQRRERGQPHPVKPTTRRRAVRVHPQIRSAGQAQCRQWSPIRRGETGRRFNQVGLIDHSGDRQPHIQLRPHPNRSLRRHRPNRGPAGQRQKTKETEDSFHRKARSGY